MAVVLIHTHDGDDELAVGLFQTDKSAADLAVIYREYLRLRELAFERIGMAIEALTLRVREADPIPVSIEQSATIGKMLDTLTVEVLRKMKVQ